uniref:Family with sequence similarity 183, member A n=1 Tax=Zonotrichia albicollis TaxID=44394 RepID=A0A8D2QDH5_ZONAL
MAARRGERDPPDARQNLLRAERAKKERRWQLLFTQYTVNPAHPVHMVSRKPMSWHENIQEPIDDEFLKLLHRAAVVPREKYSEPQTESQVIGWNTKPLVTGSVLHFLPCSLSRSLLQKKKRFGFLFLCSPSLF